MSTGTALLLSALLLALNAFFVAAEFALVASRRHRLEELAARGSAAARIALRGVRELPLMLAGAQLGITMCSLGLGAVTEPALAALLLPGFEWAGLPVGAAHVVALVIALSVVTFLHMVVGEMAAKSWAITDPERAAVVLARPFHAFIRSARPALALLNGMANGFLRLVGVEPRSELAAAHGPEELRMLVAHSGEAGTLAPVDQRLLARALELQRTPLSAVMVGRERMVTVRARDSAARVEEVARASGRSRVPVLADGADGPDSVVGVVHVRDAVFAVTLGVSRTARQLMREPLLLPATTSAYEAIGVMRERRIHLALVTGEHGVEGLVTLEDLLEELIGDFEDETDPAALPGPTERTPLGA